MLSSLLHASFEHTMLTMSLSFAAFWTLLVVFAYMLGVLFIIVSIFQCRAFAEREIPSLRTPIASFLAGTFMLALPTLVGTLTQAAYEQQPCPLCYVRPATAAHPLDAVLGLVQIIGLIAIMRSIVIMKQMGEGARDATMARAIAFMIGGVAAINIKLTAIAIGATFGLPVAHFF